MDVAIQSSNKMDFQSCAHKASSLRPVHIAIISSLATYHIRSCDLLKHVKLYKDTGKSWMADFYCWCYILSEISQSTPVGP